MHLPGVCEGAVHPAISCFFVIISIKCSSGFPDPLVVWSPVVSSCVRFCGALVAPSSLRTARVRPRQLPLVVRVVREGPLDTHAVLKLCLQVGGASSLIPGSFCLQGTARWIILFANGGVATSRAFLAPSQSRAEARRRCLPSTPPHPPPLKPFQCSACTSFLKPEGGSSMCTKECEGGRTMPIPCMLR